MALKTQGFALSQMPRAPSVPGNVGQVDVKAIYDGVRQGLDSFEAVRRAPASMLLADAEMGAKTAEAPLATRQALAQTLGIEQQTPLKTAILAAEASPETQEAKRQALLARSVKTPSGDIQLASALASAQQRLADDPSDAQAAQLVSVLAPMALKKSAISAANPQGVIDAGIQKTESTNTVRKDIAADANKSREDMAAAARESREGISAEDRALKDTLTRLGYSTSIQNTNTTAKARENAAKFGATNKIYETYAQKNEKIHEDMASLALLEEKADNYINSSLGAGVVVGSAPMVAARAIFGDTTGKELQAAISLSMKSAVETMRGLGAMSEREFQAALSQLPLTNEPEESIRTKLNYLKLVRPWILARNEMFLAEIAKGASTIQAHQAVISALPMPPVPGTTSVAQEKPTTAPPASSTSIDDRLKKYQ